MSGRNWLSWLIGAAFLGVTVQGFISSMINVHRAGSRLYVVALEDKVTEFEVVKKKVLATLSGAVSRGAVPEEFATILSDIADEYAHSFEEAGETPDAFKYHVDMLMKTVMDAIKEPYVFKPNHVAIREPFDYYRWGNEFFEPLVIKEKSRVFGLENARKIEEMTARGENVIILSNHQTEADSQILSILLQEEGMGALAERVIFIAGHKVTTDPVAIPFSMGRNLLCIHSKKHIKNPREDIPRKQSQNLESMKAMASLLNRGGQIFWVAPSGGRDRPDGTGNFVVSPFDPKALDMFKLVAMQSGKPMHFFPMSMYTHELVPPPQGRSSAVGEPRSAKRGAVSMHFLDETDGLGGLKDKVFTYDIQRHVEEKYLSLVAWHKEQEAKYR